MGDNGKSKWTRKRISVEGRKFDREQRDRDIQLRMDAFSGGAAFNSRKPLKFKPFADLTIRL